jgi:predicted PurR-regulated permease PerM
VALFLSFVVPHLISETQTALESASAVKPHPTSLKDRIFNDLHRHLRHLPETSSLVHPAISAGEQALRVLVGVFFVLATAAYWVFERDSFISFVMGSLPRPKHKKIRDTWILIDLKLGAFVRGQLLLILIVGTVVSTAFFSVGEPYWLLLGITVAILEIVPVVGPLAALLLAVGAGLRVSWHTALAAGIALL